MSATGTRRRPLVALCASALVATASVVAAQSQWAAMSGQVTRAIDGEAIEVRHSLGGSNRF